jgi:Xaa-Pro aminopeptidase
MDQGVIQMNAQEFINRRQHLIEKLPLGSVTILFSGVEIKSSADALFPFVVNKNFFYLTGLEQEHSVLMLVNSGLGIKTYVFIDEIDETKTRWVGKKLDIESAKTISGIRDVLTYSMFSLRLKEVLSQREFYGDIQYLYVDLDKNLVINHDLYTTQAFANQVHADNPSIVIENVHPLVTQLRMVKSPAEVDAIRQAIKATSYGLLHVRKQLKPELYEYQLEALFSYALKEYGNLTTSFDTIIAAGKNAIVLHYPNPKDKIQDGVLVLCDLGARYQQYAGDITRTYPASGTFNPLQRQVYEIVLQANEYIISLAKPGLKIIDLQKACLDFLAKACVKEGLIKKEEDIGLIYYHNVSHHLGLDTHDPISRELPLVPGCVITVEPGLYIKELGIGIRIEDDILITEKGSENLSIEIPKSISDIEASLRLPGNKNPQ